MRLSVHVRRFFLHAAVATVAVAFVACSSSATTPASPTQQPPIATATVATVATPTSTPAPTATATARPAPTSTPTPPATTAPTPQQATPAPTGTAGSTTVLTGRLAQGEEIFQKTAGGVGCASCHGKDGKGNIGPANRGKTADDVRKQLETNEAMEFIKLTDEEIEAVAEYLAYLATQP